MATILIVEDELPINNLIRKNLELVGHICHCAFDGLQAFDLLAEATGFIEARTAHGLAWYNLDAIDETGRMASIRIPAGAPDVRGVMVQTQHDTRI